METIKNIKEKANHLRTEDKGKAQFVRFIINGCLSASIHYIVYFILQHFIEVNISYAIGYIVSFVVNFYMTCFFTFRTAPTWKRFVGFSGSHGVNFLLHVVLFKLAMIIGIHHLIAPILVMGIAMLVQFTILNFVFKKK